MINNTLWRVLTLCFLASWLSGCSANLTETFGQGVSLAPSEPSMSGNGVPQIVEPAFAQFQDIPIPKGAKMNMERTLILGENDSWIGRLVIDSQAPKIKLFDFFKYRAGQFGWQEITSVRSTISVLAYSKAKRVMTIQIKSHPIIGTQVDITMSPKGTKPITNRGFSSDGAIIPMNRTVINPASMRPVEVR
jgi:hypothetical protein